MIPTWEPFNEDEFEKDLNMGGIFSPRQSERLREFYRQAEPSLTLPWEGFKDWITLVVSMAQPLDGKELANLLRHELFIWFHPYLQRSFSGLLEEGILEASGEAELVSVAPQPAPALRPAERMAILERDSYRCRICGASQRDKENPTVLHVDHIIPRIKRGSNDPSNLWTLCAPCNIGKGKRDLKGLDELL